MREVYVGINTEIVDGSPVAFIEFNDFWVDRENDDGYVMLYVNDENKIIQ